ncbi:BrnT family toxin [Alicyclobacillus fodiniaquatilis]|uniref:BrnT family toxin n=1 Tax=Alicyclobacillus fodiniaquatilis TaxID=1661150 RepID=A0ABW4JEG4_9BACL
MPPQFEFDWDADNEEHIARHDVDPYEVEEAMSDPNRLGFDVHDKGKKGVVGRTEDGRMLFVVYAIRDGKYRVITARDLTDQEKHAFRRRNR